MLKTGNDDRPTQRDVVETRYAARLLGVLEQAEKPMPVDDLAQQARVGNVTLSKLLLDMQQRGAVVMEGHPGAETVNLGSSMSDVATGARPRDGSGSGGSRHPWSIWVVVVPVALGIVAGFWFGGQGFTPLLVAGIWLRGAVSDVALQRDDWRPSGRNRCGKRVAELRR